MGRPALMKARLLAASLAAFGALAAAPQAGGLPKADVAPVLSPDRLDDLSDRAEPFAAAGDFAWRAFVALDWPAMEGGAARGLPDRNKTLGEDGARVWETFKSDTELFPADADGRPVAPSSWLSFDGRNPCGLDNGQKTVASFQPFADFNQPSFAAGAPSNPLVAQNREYVRYEVRFNEPEFTTIAASGWAEGRDLPDPDHPAQFPVGSIAVKAAWRPLNAADAPQARARYYVTRAAVVDIARTRAEGRVVCATRDLALVGLHIVIKTGSRPQRVWSTFEHVDNVPPAGEGEAREPDAKDAGAPYGFFDPQRPAKLLPPFGAPDTLPVDATNPPKVAPAPMQVVRRHPIDAALMAANRAYWALPGVKGTVWEHYMLVAAQWPTSRDPPGPENDGAYVPGRPNALADESYRSTAKGQENLVNATMETYLQDAPSSCMACHQAVSNARGDDFVGKLAGVR
jgi:hypothetical protein